MKKRIFLFGVFIFVVFLTGCAPKQKKEMVLRYDRPLGAGEKALRKITDPYQIPDFTLACLDLDGLQKSMKQGGKKSGGFLGLA